MRIACVWLHRLLKQAPSAPPAESARRLRAERLERLAQACWRFTPRIALAPPDSFFLDVSGSIGLFGGEEKLLEKVLAELRRRDEPARLCLADTPGAAWAGARAGGEGIDLTAVPPSTKAGRPRSRESVPASLPLPQGCAAGGQWLIIPPGDGIVAMSVWPVEALRLDAETCTTLRELGLGTIGALERLPPETLRARFGTGSALRLEQAAGRAPEPLDYLPPPREFRARLEFESPVVLQQPLQAAIGELAVRLCDQLAAAGVGSRRFELRLHRSDGKRIRHRLRTARLIQPAPQLAELLDEKMQATGPEPERGVGFDAVSLAACDTEPVSAEQADWLSGASSGILRGDLARLVDRLCSRLGADAVRTPAPQASYLPERRWRFVSALDSASAESFVEEQGKPTRAPLLLLEQAEPVDAAAAVAGGPPAWIRWRSNRYPLRRARGPRRVAPEWWLDGGPPGREYWLTEDDRGRCFHLYRESPAGDGPSRWYVQALAA